MAKIYLEKPLDFQAFCEVSTLFMEYEQKLLLLLRKSHQKMHSTWAIPGGKLESNETPIQGLMREIKEELNLFIYQNQVDFIRTVYVKKEGIDYALHLFKCQLDRYPEITLNPQEHTQYLWQEIDKVHEMTLIEGQLEVFHLVYKNQ